MDTLIPKEGSIVIDHETKRTFVIITIIGDDIYLVEKDISKIQIEVVDLFDYRLNVRMGSYEIQTEPDIVVDETKLTEDDYKKIAFIGEVEKEFGPSFSKIKKHNSGLKEMWTRHGIAKTDAWKIIRKYLQSGRNAFSVVDGRRLRQTRGNYKYCTKPGVGAHCDGVPLTDALRKQFEKYRKKYLKNKHMTIDQAYQGLIDEFYSERVEGDIKWLDEPKRPTKRQFQYYVRNNSSQREKDRKMMDEAEYRNNNRLLLGSAQYGVTRPGDMVEVDAVEVDVQIVSESDRSQSIGRAVAYVMVDVYSHAIIAIAPGLNNNAYLGLSQCFMNLIDDKVDYCARFGIELQDESLWPSCLPIAGRFDNGADFKSESFIQMCKRLGIRVDHVPPRQGSMKGMVESSFHSFHASFKAELIGKGLIEKDSIKSNHKQAIMTMSEFTTMLINFVLHYNQHYLTTVRLTKEMIDQKIKPTPTDLWEYGVETQGAPRQITERTRPQLYFDTMLKAEGATISRYGLRYNRLVYINKNDPFFVEAMLDAGKKKVAFDCRFDPRDTGSLYYLHDNRVFRAELNNMIPGNVEYGDMTHVEFDEYLKRMREQDRESIKMNQEIHAQRDRNTKKIVASIPAPGKVNTDFIHEARESEKQDLNYKERIATRDVFDNASEIYETEPEYEDYTSPEDIINNFYRRNR